MDHNKNCTYLYAAFAASGCLQAVGPTLILGLFIVTACIVAAYLARRKARGTLFENHYTWLIRTFWIGTGVWMPLFAVVGAAALFSRINVDSVFSAIGRGEIENPGDMGRLLMSVQGQEALYVTIACTVPFLAWWLSRCWRGYAALRETRTLIDVNRWI